MKIIEEEEGTKGRLVAKDDDKEMGEMTYSVANEGQLWIVDHTGVNEGYEGTGVGKALFNKLLVALRASGKKSDAALSFRESHVPKKQGQLGRA